MEIRRSVLCWASTIGLLVGGGLEAGQRFEREQRDSRTTVSSSDAARRVELGKRSYAGSETYEREAQGRVVPAAEIVETLTPRTRGARLRPRVDLRINFEFDSARMTRDGRIQADQLGEAMQMIADGGGRPAAWLLVGHTDALGTRSYNRVLSVRRARAVRTYLVEEFRFDPRDIDVEGRGEEELLDPEMSDAAHSVNRRVEVVRR